MNKQCSACLTSFNILEFYKDAKSTDNYKSRCKNCERARKPTIFNRFNCYCGASAPIRSRFCSIHRQQKYRIKTNNSSTHKYEKTINGFLMRVYRNMKSRVTGVQKLKSYLYLGKELLPKNEFYLWSKTNATFITLYKDWVYSGFKQNITPSIDRIDSTGGYTLDNIQWLTHFNKQ